MHSHGRPGPGHCTFGISNNFFKIYIALHSVRLLARRASRRPGTPIEQKMDAFGRPNSRGEREIIFNYFPKYFNISETK